MPRPRPPLLSLQALAEDLMVNPNSRLKISAGLWTSSLCSGLFARERVDGQEEMLGLLPSHPPPPLSPSLTGWSSCHGVEWISGCMSQNGGWGAFYELAGAPQSVQFLLLLFSFGLKADVGAQVKILNKILPKFSWKRPLCL